MTDFYNPAIYERDIPAERPGLLETIDAQIGYRVIPAIETMQQGFRHGALRQQGYMPLDNIEGYEQYASTLVRALNPEHMADMKATINGSIRIRETLADATVGNQLLAGLFDPINLFALPLGGPVTTTIGRSALRAGVSVAAVEAAYEVAIMQTFDPVQTAQESALNVLTSGLFGGAIGGAVAIPGARAAVAYQQTRDVLDQQFQIMRRIENLDGLTASDISSARPRAERGYIDLTDDQLSTRISELETQARALEDDGGPDGLGDQLRVQADELLGEARQLRNELGLRSLENDGIDLADPYRIMPSWFTESILFQAVSTPFKRALQSTYPSVVKEAFVRSFSDSGTALSLNALGIRTPQSVYQRAAVANGRWVAAHDQMVKLWAADTGTTATTRLDINLTDLTRRASRSSNTYREWLRNLNEKRIKKIEDLTENEIKAIGVINNYFKDAERRLEDVGLIGTRKGVENKIRLLEDEVSTLEARLARAERGTSQRSRQEADITRGRLNKLRSTLDNERMTLDSFKEESITNESEDVFFPRFWDSSAIRKKRDEFGQILYNWYQQNPRVYVMNERTGKYEVKELSTDPKAIRQRVDQTIATILNETDPTNVDNIGFGYGRSKHFRHRQVDIPNSLVTDFMITDPLAAMKTYAARIEPRYEYAKQFGKDLDGVLFDLETEMMRNNASPDEINRMRRDYMHLYDRVAGAVIRDPSSLSQKAAFVLREAASFSYMGSAGFAALPDFGRIIAEYDMGNVVRGVQALMDQNMVNMTVDEIRLAGEAIDILKGTAHLRMVEDLSNNIDANDLLSSARNAFYVLNGLAPMTGLAKQLAGVVDAHTIIDYSIKLGRGELDDQGRTWLARYGIGAEEAAKIARAPWQKMDSGLYLANTESWADNIFVPEIEGKRVNIIEINDDGTPVGKTRNGRYIPAFYDPRSNTIRFDRDYIEGPMFNEQAWLSPKVEGVNALPDIFKTPKQWSNFVMLHEIMHTRFSAEDLGFVKRQSEEIVINNAPAGMSRQEIIDNLESGVDNPDLVFHATNQPQSIINDGFLSGGTVRGTAILDSGYGDYITVFDIRDIVEKIKSNQEILDAFQITEDQVDQFLAPKMYGESAFLSKRSVDGSDFKDFNLLEGQKPVAVIHISELPQFRSRRFEGDRADELGDAGGMAEGEDAMMRDYRSGSLNKDSYGDYDLPPSYWGLSWDEFSKELDKIIELENTFADMGKNYNPFEERVSRPSTVVDKASYENRINEMALEEYRSQQTVNQETIDTFRSALNSGVLNTIMAGTPADKPIITDGVVYIPMRVASQFGMKEDPRYRGFARIENGFLGLPFQFYSYTLANVNKTVAALATGQVKNRTIGIATMMGLAYLSLKLRTPDFVWEEMSVQDKFARSFDMSGVMALYSDLFYTSMHTSLALGGPNITAGILSPKFPQDPSMLDAVTGIAGAGPSWLADTASGIYAFANGDYAGGGKTVARNLPFARLWFWKDEVNQITRAWAN